MRQIFHVKRAVPGKTFYQACHSGWKSWKKVYFSCWTGKGGETSTFDNNFG